MAVQEVGAGLWRWTAPHPGWTPAAAAPGGWGRDVGGVLAQVNLEGRGGLLLFDPLVPTGDDEARFWEELDRDVARHPGGVAVLLGNEYHGRSADAVLARYVGAATWAIEGAVDKLSCRVTRPFRPEDPLPGGATAHPIPQLSAGEVAYFLPAHRALVVSDAVLGAGSGQLRLAPSRWAGESEAAQGRYETSFRTAVSRLLDLAFDAVLTSHGEPVLTGGHSALAEALESPAWNGSP